MIISSKKAYMPDLLLLLRVGMPVSLLFLVFMHNERPSLAMSQTPCSNFRVDCFSRNLKKDYLKGLGMSAKSFSTDHMRFGIYNLKGS